MSRDKSRYALARESYKHMYPQARMHHMHPTSRGGMDTEFNLFPWNQEAHAAWHLLFCIMTVREVAQVLSDVHAVVFQADDELLVREWALPYRYHGNKSEQKDIATPQKAEKLREAWLICFGSTSYRQAVRLVRYMALHMVLGRYADHTTAIFEDGLLASLLEKVKADPERAWAFRACFCGLPHTLTLRRIKRMIQRIRSHASSIPIH